MTQLSTQKYALFHTAIGLCGIAWNDVGVLAIRLPFSSGDKMRAYLRDGFGGLEEPEPPSQIRQAVDAITALMNGEAADLSNIVLDMTRVTDFNCRVYEITRAIPPGSTLTYGDIAKRLGGVELARDVGQALAQNPFAIVVPCHRVLGAGSKPGGFSASGGRSTKLRMLAIENAYVNHTPSLFDFSDRHGHRSAKIKRADNCDRRTRPVRHAG